MLKNIKFIPPRYYSLALLLGFLILPLPIAIFLGLSPLMLYASVISAFLLFFIPGFAITSFLRNITLFERVVISLTFGITLVATLVFILSKTGLPVNSSTALTLILLTSPLIWINRKNFRFQSGVDLYDLLSALIGILVFLMMLIPIALYPIPYGSADAALHYFVSNYIRENNKLLDYFPEFSHFYANEKNSYPPASHISMALFGDLFDIPKVYSPYIYVALLHMILVLGIYVLVKKYFGKIEAIGALVFTITFERLMFIMINGQWPFYTALAMLPISIFFILNFYKEQDAKNAIFLGLLFVLQIYTHPLIFGHAILIFIIYGIFWFLINRKIPSNLYLIPMLLLIAIPAISHQISNINEFKLPSKFYLWYPTGEVDTSQSTPYFAGYPIGWYDSPLKGSILYFVMAGLVSWFLFFRRNYLLITLLISLFILFHLPLRENFQARYIVNEFILLSILAGLSLSLLKLLLNKKNQIFVPLVAIIILLVFIYSRSPVINYYLYLSENARTSEDDFNLLVSMKDLPAGETLYLGYYQHARHTAWAHYLAEHSFYFPDLEEVNNTVTLNFQNETQYLFLSTSHLSPLLKSFMDNFQSMLIGEGCEVIKSYSTSTLFSANCVKTNKLTLHYELV